MPCATVEYYVGYRYPERPGAFPREGERVTVEAIEQRWHEPAGPTFRAHAADGCRFILAYNETADTWDVQPWPP
jgi:hypothetical protein